MKSFHELEAEGAFKKTLKYPNRSDHRSYNVYFGGEVKGLSVSNEKREELIKVFPRAIVETITDDKSFQLEKKAYYDEDARIHELFKQTLFEEFGVEDNPKREKCFSVAWEKGHSSGFNEVYNEFYDLVDLIK